MAKLYLFDGIIYESEASKLALVNNLIHEEEQAAAAGISADATPGTLTLTGVAADVEITTTGGIDADATPGTLSLTGQAADQVISGNLTYEASPGSLTLTGVAADFQTGVFIDAQATPGSLSLTGQAATVDILTHLSLDAAPGSIVLTGLKADVAGLVVPTVAPAGGVKSRYTRRPRKTVIIGKKRYQVETKEEEAQLVRRYIAELETKQQFPTKLGQEKIVQRRLKLAKTRLRKLDADDPMAKLKALDDEILTILGGTPWL